MARTPPELLDVADAGLDDFSGAASGWILTSFAFSAEAVSFWGDAFGLVCLCTSTVDDELSLEEVDDAVAVDSVDVLNTISFIKIFC